MARKILFFIYVFIGSQSIRAQTNLVLNPSFETTNTCAIGYWGIDTLWFDDPAGFRTAQFWISPNHESPDYYNHCQSDGQELSTPFNWEGYQIPHTGNAYMGIAVYSLNPVFNPNGEFREYIQTKLSGKLQKGALYCGEFFVSPTYNTTRTYNVVAIGDMAMAITPDQPFNDERPLLQVPTSHTAILLNPQIEQQTAISRDTGAWQRIQGIYKAKGGEEWLTIGNFRTLANTDTALIRAATDPVSQSIYFGYYYIDDVSLVKVSDPVFSAHDTAVCSFPCMVKAGEGFDRYQWNTGDTTQVIEVTGPGEYWVKVRLENCGEATDTIHIAESHHFPLLMQDTVICSSILPITLAAPAGFLHYSWSDGQIGSSATFSSGGHYSLEAESTCGIQKDSFAVIIQNEVPDFDLGDRADLCQDDQNVAVLISPSVLLPNYLWSNGSQNSSITVTEPGQYWLSSQSLCGKKVDSILVTGCPSKVYIPNVFSPNGDGINDYFTISGRSIKNVTLSVYSRWGEEVYQENGVELRGWDGNFRGHLSPSGVYIYLLTYEKEDSNIMEHESGEVLLVR